MTPRYKFPKKLDQNRFLHLKFVGQIEEMDFYCALDTVYNGAITLLRIGSSWDYGWSKVDEIKGVSKSLVKYYSFILETEYCSQYIDRLLKYKILM